MTHPIDNLVRARYDTGTIELRDAGSGDAGDGRTLFGHFAVFDTWTRIDSWFEGTFMERVAKGAFKRTFKEDAGQIRVMYEHGRDPQIGNKPIGAPDVMREDDEGAYYESSLFDADYANQLLPALRAKQLGASFRFSVRGEEWIEPRKATDHNPERLKERTITDVRHYEHGPVTWGAYAEASAGVRSGTDEFLESFMADPTFVARFTDRCGLKVVEKILASLPDDVRSLASATTSTDGDLERDNGDLEVAIARARFALHA